MKIAVVAPSPVPFVVGGAEGFSSALVREINDTTEHAADLIKLPVKEQTLPDIVASYQAFTKLDLDHFDLVISSKYPAWMIDHPNHSVYMLHKLRALYEMYGLFQVRQLDIDGASDLVDFKSFLSTVTERSQLDELFARFDALVASRGFEDPALVFPGPLARRLVQTLDRIGLAPGSVRRYFAISRTVASRADTFPPGVPVQVVYPAPAIENFHSRSWQHLLCVSRLDQAKRIDLVINAMRHVTQDITLAIVGGGADEDRLRTLASRDPRVRFMGDVPRRELVDLYADALGVVFVPTNEDLGLVALEAMRSAKPLVTCRDSGGPTEFVVHGVNGFVTEPDPRAVGSAINALVADPGLARVMGERGEVAVRSVTWASAIRGLLEPSHRPARPIRLGRRPTLVVPSTYAIHPRLGGGQMRCFHLCRELAADFDVEIVSLAEAGSNADRIKIADGVFETVVPKSKEHESSEQEVALRVGFPVTDIVAAVLTEKTPAFARAVRQSARAAAAVILNHPYLYSTLERMRLDLPLIYSATDAELALKSRYLPENEDGAWLARVVRSAEREVLHIATVLIACSDLDARILGAEYGVDPSSFHLVPHGVDTNQIRYVSRDERSRSQRTWLSRFASTGRYRSTALFIGSWHPPNLHAADVIARFAPELSEVCFLMVGSHSGHVAGRSLPPNMTLMGAVSDRVKGGLLASAGIALNPMTIGSGANYKVGEYLAAGVPLVSTPFGVRGWDVKDGVHAALAPVDRFPEMIRSIIDDPDPVEPRTASGRKLIEERYDWRVLGANFRGIIKQTVVAR